MRDVLLDEAKRSGRVPDALAAAAIPVGCEALWTLFLELHNHRRVTGLGLAPFVVQDVEAHCRLVGIELTTWEYGTLLDMDLAAIEVMIEGRTQ